MSGKPSIYKGLRKWGYFLFEKDMLYFDMRNEEIRTGEKMGQFTIYREDVPGVTLLSNSFIDNYMKDANDAQLKIYLYLLRRLGSGQAASVSEIADFFNHTEREVLRSLKYWEKLKLLAIEYDESKNVSGIRFLKGTDEPVTVAAPAVAAATVVVSATAITEKQKKRLLKRPTLTRSRPTPQTSFLRLKIKKTSVSSFLLRSPTWADSSVCPI